MKQEDVKKMEYMVVDKCCAKCKYIVAMSTRQSCAFYCKHPNLSKNYFWENKVHTAGLCKCFEPTQNWIKDVSVHEMVVGGQNDR